MPFKLLRNEFKELSDILVAEQNYHREFVIRILMKNIQACSLIFLIIQIHIVANFRYSVSKKAIHRRCINGILIRVVLFYQMITITNVISTGI